jgi:anthranilate synthase component 1
MDSAILIRTLVIEKDRVSIQAGAGVVADSDPEKEWQETLNKASALISVIESLVP